MAIIDKVYLKDANGVETPYDIGASANNVAYDSATSIKSKVDSVNTNLNTHTSNTVLSANGVHNIRYNGSNLQVYNNGWIDITSSGGSNIDVIGPKATPDGQNVGFNWSDSNSDKWKNTYLVRKTGSAPGENFNPNSYSSDLTIVGYTTTKNNYSSANTLADNNLTYGTVYYYRFFTGIDSNGSGTADTWIPGTSIMVKLSSDIVPIIKGGTGNSFGYIRTGQLSGSTTGDRTTIEGKDNVAKGIASHAEGTNTSALENYSHAEGNNTKANGQSSHAEGVETLTGFPAAHAEGYKTTANYGHAEGYQTSAYSNGSHAEGRETVAKGDSAHAEGYQTTADIKYAHAEGQGTSAHGEKSHAEGLSTCANGPQSHAEGQRTYAIGGSSHAEGIMTTAQGNYSHAEGEEVIAIGNTSHAEGSYTTARYGHAEGASTYANGANSHAEGWQTVAYLPDSHAEGRYSTAYNNYSHAEGLSTSTCGDCGHAEGYNTTAGKYAHSQGQNTYAGFDQSVASGQNTYAQSQGNFVHGRGKGSEQKLGNEGGTWGQVIFGDESQSKFSSLANFPHGKGFCFGVCMNPADRGTSGTALNYGDYGASGLLYNNGTYLDYRLETQGMYMLFIATYTVSTGKFYSGGSYFIIAGDCSSSSATGTITSIPLGISGTVNTISFGGSSIHIQALGSSYATQVSLVRVG